MDEARSKHWNAHDPQWNWQYWDGLLVGRAENVIVELTEKFDLHIRLFDDNAQACLQSNTFGVHVAMNAMPFSFFHLADVMRRENNLFSVCYTFRANGFE